MLDIDAHCEAFLGQLQRRLPTSYSYHDVHHTLYVMDRAAFLVSTVDTTPHERGLLKLAALYHDAGFLLSHLEHEAYSCELARAGLLELGLTATDTEAVCEMIMATAIPQRPNSQLAAVLADADLFYLGTDLYQPTSEKLYQELKHFNPGLSLNQWVDIQRNFLIKHHYHTPYGREVLAPVKQVHLQALKNS